MREPRLIPVGKIARTHGVRGMVKIYPYGESLAIQGPGDELFLHSTPGEPSRRVLTLLALKPQGKFLLARFEELGTVDAAQTVVGKEVFLPEDRLPPTEEDEYYHYQLIGLNVVTTRGGLVGKLVGILETGAHDVYVVDHNGKETLIPAIAEIISEVDLDAGRIVVDPPEGLMDDL